MDCNTHDVMGILCGGWKVMAPYSGGEFSVTQYFTEPHEPRQRYEVIRSHVTAEKAVEVFKFYTTNVSANVGLTKRVIVTDGGDCINMEWRFGKGIVYPTEEDIKKEVN